MQSKDDILSALGGFSQIFVFDPQCDRVRAANGADVSDHDRDDVLQAFAHTVGRFSDFFAGTESQDRHAGLVHATPASEWLIGDPIVDAATERLLTTLSTMAAAVGILPMPVEPLILHMAFVKAVKLQAIVGIGDDDVRSVSAKADVLHAGVHGLTRTDCVMRNGHGAACAIWAVMTGEAAVTPTRIRRLFDHHSPRDLTIPLVELRVRFVPPAVQATARLLAHPRSRPRGGIDKGAGANSRRSGSLPGTTKQR